MGVYTFVCRRSGGEWCGKQHKEGDLEASAGSTYELQRKLVQTVVSTDDSSGGVHSSFSFVTPQSAVFQVIVGGAAFVGGGGGVAAAASGGAAAPAAEAAAPAEEKKAEKEESEDEDLGFSLFDD